jgi:phage tail tape-measure protein
MWRCRAPAKLCTPASLALGLFAAGGYASEGHYEQALRQVGSTVGATLGGWAGGKAGTGVGEQIVARSPNAPPTLPGVMSWGTAGLSADEVNGSFCNCIDYQDTPGLAYLTHQ